MSRLRLFALLALLVLLWPAAAVHADGIIIDPPLPCERIVPCPPGPERLFPLTVQNHHVTVTIDNQVATTHVEEVFRNDNNYTVEGTYIFPIPAEATVDDFAMWIDGQRVAGKVLTPRKPGRCTTTSCAACLTRPCWNTPGAARCRPAFSRSRPAKRARWSWSTARCCPPTTG